MEICLENLYVDLGGLKGLILLYIHLGKKVL